MTMRISLWIHGIAAALLAASADAAPPSIGGCQIFPANNIWNTRVDNLPVHPSSATWVANMSPAANLRFDWGNEPPLYGIPYTTVPGSQPNVPINFGPDGFEDESDPGPFPIPPSAPVEGDPDPDGDRHVLVIETGNCMLYELYRSFSVGGGTSWTVDSSAKYDLKVNGPLREASWTSADAAGLPIFPGLVLYEQAVTGEINHALRFTTPSVYGGPMRDQWIWPARHYGANTTNANLPRYGARFRLKASFDISGYNVRAQVILSALKKYGMILADQGSAWFVSGMSNSNWPSAMFSQVHSTNRIAGSNFEAVDTSLLMIDPNSAAARQLGNARDMSGDGNADLVWRNASDGSVQAWLMNGLTATQVAGLIPAGGYAVTHSADLDGDGKYDLLIRHTDGSVQAWIMNGLAVAASSVLGAAGSGWSVVKTGDLNGDGKADIVWQHTDGTVQAWLMNGTSILSAATFVPAGSGWSVSQIADLDGDGKSDIIWQHSSGTVQAWLMNGLSATSIASYVPAGSGWSVVLTGDFNGDGKADLMWQHADGTTQAWLMNGLAVSSVASFTPAATGWTPILAGDLDGDAKADLFWQHTSGASQTWLMNGLTAGSLASFVPGGTGWSASHLVDLNGDARKDVLWKHTSGAVQGWLMNGLTVAQIGSLAGTGSYVVVP